MIKGSAINNDGAQKVSYTAPGVDGQKRNLYRVIQRAGIDINHIGLIEAHGTGTLLGDPVEMGALAQTFSELGYRNPQKVTVGSVKSNIGHLDTAAGMAAFIKTVCAIYYGMKPGTASFNVLNPALASDDNPLFTVSGESERWPETAENRHALVCALGAGGTNGHIMVSGYQADPASQKVACTEHSGGGGYAVLCLSGKSATALNANMQAMADFLRHTTYALEDICASQARTRAFHAYRCVVFGTTREEMIAHLATEDVKHIFRGEKKRRTVKKKTVYSWLDADGKFSLAGQKELLAEAIITGEIEPNDLFSHFQTRYVALPGYCFDRVRCWIDAAQQTSASLPIYQSCWQPLEKAMPQDEARGILLSSENTLSVGHLAEQSKAILQRITCGQTGDYLLLQDDGVDRHHVVDQLTSLGHFLHQLDQTVTHPLTLVFFSRHSAWPEEEPVTAAASISAMIRAALKAASHELLNIQLQWLDVSATTTQPQVRQAISYLLSTRQDGMELAQHGEQLWHSVLSVQTQNNICPQAMLAANDAVVLVGGNGGLGRQLQACYLRQGVKHFFIISRRSPEEAVCQEIDSLARQGIYLYWIEGDAGQSGVWEELVRQVVERELRVKTLYHLAGVLNDAPLASLTAEGVARVLAPKLDTCDRIEDVLPQLRPQSVVLYSSLSAALGSPAQYAYAAANAYLDSWAGKMQQKGQNVKSIQWGPWEGEGMAGIGSDKKASHNARRIAAISDAEGMQVLERVFSGSASVYMAARLPVSDNEFIEGKMTCTALGRRIFDPFRSDKAGPSGYAEDKLNPPALSSLITAVIREMAGAGQDHPAFTQMTFSALGLDSLAMTHLRKRIATEAGVTLTIGELYSYPTVSSLIDYLQQRIVPEREVTGTSTQVRDAADEEERVRRRLVTEICQLLS